MTSVVVEILDRQAIHVIWITPVRDAGRACARPARLPARSHSGVRSGPKVPQQACVPVPPQIDD